jgi:hypothetical protein
LIGKHNIPLWSVAAQRTGPAGLVLSAHVLQYSLWPVSSTHALYKIHLYTYMTRTTTVTKKENEGTASRRTGDRFTSVQKTIDSTPTIHILPWLLLQSDGSEGMHACTGRHGNGDACRLQTNLIRWLTPWGRRRGTYRCRPSRGCPASPWPGSPTGAPSTRRCCT